MTSLPVGRQVARRWKTAGCPARTWGLQATLLRVGRYAPLPLSGRLMPTLGSNHLNKRPFGFAKPEGSSFPNSSVQAHSACCARFASILAHVSFRLTERLNTSLPPAGSENCLLTNVPFLIHY